MTRTYELYVDGQKVDTKTFKNTFKEVKPTVTATASESHTKFEGGRLAGELGTEEAGMHVLSVTKNVSRPVTLQIRVPDGIVPVGFKEASDRPMQKGLPNGATFEDGVLTIPRYYGNQYEIPIFSPTPEVLKKPLAVDPKNPNTKPSKNVTFHVTMTVPTDPENNNYTTVETDVTTREFTRNLFFNNPKTANKPGFKSRKKSKQGFKTDRARIIDGRLVLDNPRAYKGEWMSIRFKGASIPDGKLKLCAITRTKGKYIATITMDVETVALPKTGKKTAVDANVDHFDTMDGQIRLKPELLDLLYERVRTYQRQLARKRKVNKNYRHSKGYQATRAKLQATYERIHNVQNDLLHKFTTDLYRQNDTVVIEDLDVKGMQMKKKAKNLHRSLFGRFHQFMEYKAEKFGKTLIIADRFYPSTQRCSNCGHVKTGDEKITLSGNAKHGTKHHEYVCYKCGHEDDRDHNAVLNLLALAK